MAKRLRLAKVLVQPVFFLDDGKTLEELEHPAVTLTPEEWEDDYPARFKREAEAFEQTLNLTPAAEQVVRRKRKPKAKPKRK
jgi:hypothetical protein